MRVLKLLLAAAFLAAPPLAAPALTMKPGTAWPTSTIPVCWEAPRREHRQERDLIRKAIAATWERESALSFTGWRTCRAGEGGIRIALENGYPRTRGRGVEIDGLEGGVVLPALWSLAALSVNLKAPVHEFGHALGFGHEYARRDILDPGTCGGTDRSGQAYYEDDLALTPYDARSVMVGCRARANRQFSQGVPELSPGDIFGLVRTYGSHPANVLDADEAGDLFGAAMVAADLDGDGRVDLAIGAPGEDGGQGAVYLYRGTERRGFRPWRKVSAEEMQDWHGLTQLGMALRTVAGDEAEAPVALLIRAETGGGPTALRITLAEDGVTGRATAPAEVPARAVAAPDFAEAAAAGLGAYPFPDLSGPGGRAVVHLSLDLDRDGIADHVLGAPHADGEAPGSGVVIVLRGTADGGALPWYWFGQSY